MTSEELLQPQIKKAQEWGWMVFVDRPLPSGAIAWDEEGNPRHELPSVSNDL